jgi:hypothetical protein
MGATNITGVYLQRVATPLSQVCVTSSSSCKPKVTTTVLRYVDLSNLLIPNPVHSHRPNA